MDEMQPITITNIETEINAENIENKMLKRNRKTTSK